MRSVYTLLMLLMSVGIGWSQPNILKLQKLTADSVVATYSDLGSSFVGDSSFNIVDVNDSLKLRNLFGFVPSATDTSLKLYSVELAQVIKVHEDTIMLRRVTAWLLDVDTLKADSAVVTNLQSTRVVVDTIVAKRSSARTIYFADPPKLDTIRAITSNRVTIPDTLVATIIRVDTLIIIKRPQLDTVVAKTGDRITTPDTLVAAGIRGLTGKGIIVNGFEMKDSTFDAGGYGDTKLRIRNNLELPISRGFWIMDTGTDSATYVAINEYPVPLAELFVQGQNNQNADLWISAPVNKDAILVFADVIANSKWSIQSTYSSDSLKFNNLTNGTYPLTIIGNNTFAIRVETDTLASRVGTVIYVADTLKHRTGNQLFVNGGVSTDTLSGKSSAVQLTIVGGSNNDGDKKILIKNKGGTASVRNDVLLDVPVDNDNSSALRWSVDGTPRYTLEFEPGAANTQDTLSLYHVTGNVLKAKKDTVYVGKLVPTIAPLPFVADTAGKGVGTIIFHNDTLRVKAATGWRKVTTAAW